jgi:hypothetical protein
VGGCVLFACQGPDEYFRSPSSSTGAGGSASGGATATGGSIETGGSTGVGLATGAGGVVATGGVKGDGGSTSGLGGAAGRAAGGAPGSGGTPATGGAAGRAGVSGAAGVRGGGGAAGAPGGGGSGGGTCASCKLVIDAACQDGTGHQQGKVVVDVVNTAGTGLPLSQVTFRYWFQLGETTDPPTLTVDYAMLMSSVITSKFVALSPARAGANEYFEVGFTSKAPALAAFSESGQIQLRFNAAGFSTMFLSDQTMDYSFQACPASATPNNPPYNSNQHITGYINGVLVFGTEPM